MISDKLLTEYSYIVSARFEAINTRYIKLMARQIKEIGKLTPSNIKRLEQMSKMSTNIAEINNLLATESNMTLNELYKVYDMSGMSIYQDAEKLYKSNGKTQVPFEQNARLQAHLESMKMLTKGTFSNLSNTTATHEGYRQLVDMALDAVASGTDNYQSVIDNILTNPDLSSLGRSIDGGLRVQYASGYTRRLDSAVRMNVLSGLRELNNGVNEIAGKEFGADGMEITAHALCAEDHLPVQGRQFAKGPAREVNGTFYPSFEQMNSQLRRKISTWNCKHSTRVILLGVSGPSYTEEELEQYKNLSTQKVKIGDKEVTRYQASQMMRNLETEMRYAKDKIIFAEEAGFPDIQSKAEQRLTDLRNRYNYVSNQANLQQQLDRTYVPGFKGIGNPKPEDIILKPIDIQDTQKDIKPIKVSHKIAEGKDITGTWTRRENEFDFEIEDVINAQGFDGLPRVVDADEFDKLVEESNFIAQRTYSAPSQEILKEYQDQLYNGKWYVDCSTGGAVHGKGMYTAGYKGTTINKWLDDTMIGYGSQQSNSITETMTFAKDFKFTTPEELTKIKMDMQTDYTKKSMQLSMDSLSGKISMEEAMQKNNELMENLMNNTKDDGQLAALLGYDGIRVNRGEGEFFVVLNRTKVIFKKG